METKFKDVAHLYLGVEVVNTIGKHMGKIVSVSIDGTATINPLDEFKPRVIILNSLKPILRPLSDITKDELSTLWSIVFTREFNGVIHKHKANDTGRGSYAAERYVMSSGVERLGVEFDGNIWADSDLSVWRHNKHKITAYLLSKHFDLFGLIESGEAIDKAKLSQNTPNQ